VVRFFFGAIGGFFGQPVSPKCMAHKFALVGKTGCTAGPYMPAYSQWVTGSKEVYVPNPYYFDKSQQPWSKVVYLAIPTAPAMLAALKTGEIDLAQGDPTTASNAQSAGFKVVSGPQINWGLVLYTKSVPPLASLQVRQAMNYAVNRKALASLVGSRPTDEFMTTDGVDPNPKIANYYPYDPAKAKSLLASAGYPNGFTMKVVSYGPGGQYGTPLIQAAASQLAQVGIKLDITSAASDTQEGSLLQAGGWAAVQWNFGLNPMAIYYNIFMAGAYGWTDPVVTTLDKAGFAAPPKKAAADWRRITDRLVEQAYYLPLVQGNGYWYFNSSRLKAPSWPALTGPGLGYYFLYVRPK
jgi:peptide/nickel transport system substrate-binding protein